VKYWEIIADNLSQAGWSWGCVAALDCEGRTISIADAHRNKGKRFVVHADEILTAFLELESTIRRSRSVLRSAKFLLQTAQFHETQCESETTQTPSVHDSGQAGEKPAKTLV
jgi:hypothetical protein